MEMTNTQFIISLAIQIPISFVLLYFVDKYYKNKGLSKIEKKLEQKQKEVSKMTKELFELKKDVDVNCKRNVLTEKVFTFKQIPAYAILHYSEKSGFYYLLNTEEHNRMKEILEKVLNWEHKKINQQEAINFYLNYYINGKFNV